MAKKFELDVSKPLNAVKQFFSSAKGKMKKRNVAIIVRLCVPTLALVFIVIGVAFSWFNFNKEASAEDFSVTTVKVNNTLISKDGKEWTDGIVFDQEKNISFKPVAGDGNSFYLQRQYGDDGARIGEWETLEDGRQFFVPSYDYKVIDDLASSEALVCVDFQIKSDSDSKLYLDPASSVSPKTEAALADNAAAAIRVAMYSVDESNNAKLLFMWVPNTTYEVKLPTDSDPQTEVVTGSEAAIETIKLTTETDGTFTSEELNTDKTSSGCTEITESAYLFWGDLKDIKELNGESNSPTPILETKGGESQSVRIVIWFEATDRECESVFAGGKISTELFFKSELN